MIDIDAILGKARKITLLATNIKTTKKYAKDIATGEAVLKIGYGKETLNINSVLGEDMLNDIKAYIKAQSQKRIESLENELEEVLSPSSHKKDKKG